MNKLLDKILTEWAYRVHDGMPNINNPLHIVQLKETLQKLKFNNEAIDLLINNLIMEKEFKARNKDGRVVDFDSEDARDAAIDAGTHFKLDKEDDKTKKEPSKPKIVQPDKHGGMGKDDETDKKETATQRKNRENGEQHQRDQKIAAETHNSVYSDKDIGQLLDEGDDDNDSEVKHNMLTYGFTNQKEKTGKDPAPGNAGSAFNEIVSGEGAKILRAAEEKEVELNEQQLAKVLYKQFCNTALGKEIKSGVKVKNNTKHIPNDADSGCYEKCLLSARSAIRKHERTKNIKQNLGEEGTNQLKGETKVTEFYGAEDSINAQVNMIEKAEKVLAPDGTKIPKESTWRPAAPYRNEGESYKDYHRRVQDWARKNNAERLSVGALDMAIEGGGGANPSDTATFITDEDGNLVMAFTSDKMSTDDIQANSTLEYEINQKIQWVKDDPYLSPEQKENLTALLLQQKEEINRIEKGLKRVLTTASSNLKNEDINKLVQMLADDKLMDGTTDPKIGRGGRGTKKYWSGKNGALKSYGPSYKHWTKRARLRALEPYEIAYDVPIRRAPFHGRTKQDYYSQNPPSQEEILMAILTKSENHPDDLTDSEMKIIERVSSRLREHYKNQSGSINQSRAKDYDIPSKSEQVRRDTVAANRRHRKELNEIEITTESGEKMGYGDYLEAKNLSDKLHLGQIGKDTAHGVYKYDGLMEVNMGGVQVNPEVLRRCLDLETEDELIDSFEVGPPEEEDEIVRSTGEHETDEDGNLFYWAVNKDGEYSSDDNGNTIPAEPEGTGEITTDINKAGKKPKKVGRVTGRNVFIYAVTQEGKRIPVAKKVLRSKTGKLGKLQTVYHWSPEIQDCFKDDEPPENEPVEKV